MTRPRTVDVPVSELSALRRGWAAYQEDDGAGYEQLGDAVVALLRRESAARRGTVGVQAAGDPEDEAS